MSKSFVNISLTIKEFLRNEDETQYTNYQKNDLPKIKFTPQKNTIHLSGLVARYDSLNVAVFLV